MYEYYICVCWLYIMCISSYIISYTYYANIYAVLYLWQLCRYRYVWLPGAPFFAWNSIYFWSLLGKNVAASQKRSCSKWSRIARMKGNQQTCCRWQWCHSWSIGNKVDWHGLDGLWALDLQPFVPFHCDSDISKTTKTIRNWGTGKNAFVSGRNAFVSGRNAFVLVQSAVTKIVLPRRPINKR